MTKTSDKQRVLKHMMKQTSEQTTAKIATSTGVPHPSARRILNELRAEGHVTRGALHGTWLSLIEEVAALEAEPTLDDAPEMGDEVLDILDVNARDDAPEPVVAIYKVECQDDTIYVLAVDEDDAYTKLNAALTTPEDPLPRDIVTFTKVDALPEGEELFSLDLDEPASDDEPSTEIQ
jgi:hypothetical protein